MAVVPTLFLTRQKMLNNRLLKGLLTSLVILVSDQLTKYWIVFFIMRPPQVIEIGEGLMDAGILKELGSPSLAGGRVGLGPVEG